MMLVAIVPFVWSNALHASCSSHFGFSHLSFSPFAKTSVCCATSLCILVPDKAVPAGKQRCSSHSRLEGVKHDQVFSLAPGGRQHGWKIPKHLNGQGFLPEENVNVKICLVTCNCRD